MRAGQREVARRAGESGTGRRAGMERLGFLEGLLLQGMGADGALMRTPDGAAGRQEPVYKKHL